MKRLAPRLTFIALAVLVAGCQSSGSFCRLYEPIPTLDGTPEEVQLAINRNNVVYCRQCDPDCPL